MELVIRVPGEPFAQPRARAAIIAGRAVIYDPKRAKNWKATAQMHMIAASQRADHCRCFEGPVSLSVLAIFTCPKSDVRKRDPRPRRWHTKKPDGDNVLKAVKDAAKGVLWLDDAQVAVATVTKIIGAQGEAPYVEVRVSELTEEILETGGDALRNAADTAVETTSFPSVPASSNLVGKGGDCPRSRAPQMCPSTLSNEAAKGGEAQRPLMQESTVLGNEAPVGADSPGPPVEPLPLFERRD